MSFVSAACTRRTVGRPAVALLKLVTVATTRSLNAGHQPARCVSRICWAGAPSAAACAAVRRVVSWARLTTPATVISHCGSFVLSMSVLLVAMLLPEAIEGARWLRRRRPDARSRGRRRADLGGEEPKMTG